MPNRCIVGGCSNVTDAKKVFSLHLNHFTPFEFCWRRDVRSEKETQTEMNTVG